ENLQSGMTPLKPVRVRMNPTSPKLVKLLETLLNEIGLFLRLLQMILFHA
ncbi:MAG: hypothetical protein HY709_02965, partial [Candidatus Latescibacteria bacterium]|nr:hypothetical protein [Candidatus Latescibacterota bacterium]